MHPAHPKRLEPAVKVRLAREYREVDTVLEYSTLNSKHAYSARTLYLAKSPENFCQPCMLSARRFIGACVDFNYPILSERACYFAVACPKNAYNYRIGATDGITLQRLDDVASLVKGGR